MVVIKSQLLEILNRHSVISNEVAELLRSYCKRWRTTEIQSLKFSGVLDEHQIVLKLSELLDIDCILSVPLEEVDVKILNYEKARYHVALLLKSSKNEGLQLVMADPTNQVLIDDVKNKIGKNKFELVVARYSDIINVSHQAYLSF